jgi:predicted Zn-dependent protease/tRNA A-37 threonylcarbamoyl transferase component Bud32
MNPELQPAKVDPTDIVVDDDGAGSGTDTVLPPGTVLGEKYEIVEILAEGGMATVYKARQDQLDRFVAIKVMHKNIASDPQAQKRFKQEAKAAGALLHENLVAVFDYGLSSEKQPYIVMDLVAGKPLSQLLKEQKTLTIDEFLEIFGQVCLGLQHAHSHNLVHRDLKPNNILIADEPDSKGRKCVKIVDFGIAKMMSADGQQGQQHLTQTGEIFGSPFYMSPEQCQGMPLDARADLYSLGCTMYESLVGTPPFPGNNAVETLYKHLHEIPRFPVEARCRIPEPVQQLVEKLLCKQKEKRYQTAAAVKATLEYIDEGKFVPHRNPLAAYALAHPAKALFSLAAVMVLATTGWKLVGAYTSPTEPPPAPFVITEGEFHMTNRLPDRILPAPAEAEPKAAALSAAKARVDANPHSAADWYAYAMALSEAEQRQEARRAVGNSLSYDPADVRSLCLSGWLFSAERNLPAATQEYRKALKVDPHSYAGLVGLRDALWQQRLLAEAATVGQKVVAQEPGDAVSWYALGQIYRDNQQLHPAIEAFRHATKADPTYSYGWWGLAEALKDTGDESGAQQATAMYNNVAAQ